MNQLLADSTEVATWLTPDIVVQGVSIGALIVVGLWWMARHARIGAPSGTDNDD
jgi:hypothetical protein